MEHTHRPKLLPVEEYLSPQRRFRHLFLPARQNDVIEEIQAEVDAYWKQAGFDPQAVREKTSSNGHPSRIPA